MMKIIHNHSIALCYYYFFSPLLYKHPRQLFHLQCQVHWFELSSQWTCYAEEDTRLGTQHWTSLCTRWNADRKQLYGPEVGRRWSLYLWIHIFLQVRYPNYYLTIKEEPQIANGGQFSWSSLCESHDSGFYKQKEPRFSLINIKGIRVWGSLHCEIEEKNYILLKRIGIR